MPNQVERWGIFELSLQGPQEENPYRDIQFCAEFILQQRSVSVEGFYDGDGIYRVRFMPDQEGQWRCLTHSNLPAIDLRRVNSFAPDPRQAIMVQSGQSIMSTSPTRMERPISQ